MSKPYEIEPWGDGFIVADYSGHRGEAAYAGADCVWKAQPVGMVPFPTEEAAEEFAKVHVKPKTE